MNKIVAIIDDDQKVLTEVENAIKKQIEGVTVLSFRPEQLGILPTGADVFVVDFDMGETSGSEIIRKIRETNKKARVIVWGIPLDPSGEEKILLFEAGANFIIDKYVENIATVIKSALSRSKESTLVPASR